MLKNKANLVGHYETSPNLCAEINVLDAKFYVRLLTGGSIGAAEFLIDKAWETPNLTAVIQVFARNMDALDKLERKVAWLTFPINKYRHWANRNHKAQAKKNISAHYDLGNELYTRFLDKYAVLECFVLQGNETLEQAQLNKMDRLCRKLELKPTDHLLEIGTGWGGLAIFAAQNYGCQVTTTTISEEQYQYVAERIKSLGLEDRITLLKEDYRDHRSVR